MLDDYRISNVRPLHKSRTEVPQGETRRDENGYEDTRDSVFRYNFRNIGLFFVSSKKLMHYKAHGMRLEAVSIMRVVGR